MARPNINTRAWDREAAVNGFSSRAAQLGEEAGARRLAANVFEVDAGAASMPYHFHRAIEEMMVVLRGTPSIRTPEGERELAEGEVVAFRAGPTGAHQVINRASKPVRYLMISTRRSPDIGEYPDSGKVGLVSEPLEGDDAPLGAMLRKSDQLGYFEGEEWKG